MSPKFSEAQTILSNLLSEHFFVDAIWVPVWRPFEGKRGSMLELIGSPDNLELAAYVYAFLMATSERLWGEHKKREGISGNRDRRAYVAGVMAGFREQLERQAKKDQEEGLVWLGDPELDRYFRARFPRVRWSRYQSTRGTTAHQHGRAASERIVLHRGMKQGPSAGGPKLLSRGIVLEDGYRTKPASVRLESYSGKGAWLRIILREGRKRQIRVMGALTGLPVVRIIRIRIGSLLLGSLKPKEWRHLSSEEITALKSPTTQVKNIRRKNKPEAQKAVVKRDRKYSLPRQ